MYMSFTVSRDHSGWGLKQIDYIIWTSRYDRQRLVFHGHFVCLSTIMPAYISEAAQGQSQMKLISINPFQIRRGDGKRTAFKRPRRRPHLPCWHNYLLSCDAACLQPHCRWTAATWRATCRATCQATFRATSAHLNRLEHSKDLRRKKVSEGNDINNCMQVVLWKGIALHGQH